MKATDFEVRYQPLLHLLLVSLAFLTYLFQRDDIVWFFVKSSSNSRLLERSFFGAAALLMGTAAILCTWARAYSGPGLSNPAPPPTKSPYSYLRHPWLIGSFLYSVGLASLAPISGFLILIFGEALLTFRLIRRADSLASSLTQSLPQPEPPPSPNESALPWPQAIRQESAKWGLFLTMVVFTILLIDRLAEILALASLLLWLLLNLPRFLHPRSRPWISNQL